MLLLAAAKSRPDTREQYWEGRRDGEVFGVVGTLPFGEVFGVRKFKRLTSNIIFANMVVKKDQNKTALTLKKLGKFWRNVFRVVFFFYLSNLISRVLD